MDVSHEVFQKAINTFADQLKLLLSERQIEWCNTTTVQQVKREVLAIQNEQETLKSMMDLNRFHSFIEAFEQFDDVCQALHVNIPNLSNFIWGPTKIILQRAKEDRKALDCILVSYSELGRKLPLLAQYTPQLTQRSEIKRCLALMYHDLLHFNTSLLKLFKNRGWKHTFAANWKDYDGPFQTLLRAFDLHGDILKSVTDTQRYQDAQERMKNTHRQVNDHVLRYENDRDELSRHISEYERDREKLLAEAREGEIQRRNTQYLKVITWLDSPGATDSWKKYHDHQQAIISEHPTTGSWILQEDKVHDWINAETPTHSILWIHGKKGAGKTILASVVIDHLQKHQPEFKTSYFYCRESDLKLAESRFLAISKSLLTQMICHDRELLPVMHERRMAGVEKLTSEGTAKALLELGFDTSVKQFIVIDGLDEIIQGERGRLIDCLSSIVDNSDSYSPGRIRVLLVSTNVADVRKRVQSAENVDVYEIHPDQTQRDIKRFVSKKAASLKEKYQLGVDDVELVQSLVCNNSRGMFLYASLVMENLAQQPNHYDFMTELRIRNFPTDLKAAYKRIIKRLRKTGTRDSRRNTWKEAKRIFGWLACAKRPLKWHELQAVMSMKIGNDGVVDLNDRTRRLSKDIHEMCGSLVQVVGGDSIEFIHQTAKEHIMTSENLSQKNLEFDVAILCLGYLSHDCFSSAHDTDDRNFFAQRGHYAFQDYAISMWSSHFNSVFASPADKRADDSMNGSAESNADSNADNSAGMSDVEVTIPEYKDRATKTLRLFCKVYQTGLAATSFSDEQVENVTREATTYCEKLSDEPFYEDLLQVCTHVIRHQKKGLKERNEVSIPELAETLAKNRLAIQKIDGGLIDGSSEAERFREAYGERFFKCTRVPCAYFYEGYATEQELKSHLDRHERPYECIDKGCSYSPFGFSSNKDRDKHIRQQHPHLSDQPEAFAQLDDRPKDAKFQCNLCARSYTRNAHLVAHRNSKHLGVRPFACPVCDKKFTRRNDLTRHDRRIHRRHA